MAAGRSNLSSVHLFRALWVCLPGYLCVLSCRSSGFFDCARLVGRFCWLQSPVQQLAMPPAAPARCTNSLYWLPALVIVSIIAHVSPYPQAGCCRLATVTAPAPPCHTSIHWDIAQWLIALAGVPPDFVGGLRDEQHSVGGELNLGHCQ